MFGALKSALDYLTGSTEENDDIVPRVAGLPARGTADLPHEGEEKYFVGKVTSIHSGYALINNEIYFAIDSMPNSYKPSVGDRVNVTARRKHETGGWRASSVTPMLEWDEDEETEAQDEVPVCTSASVASSQPANDHGAEHKQPTVGMVTALYEDYGIINDELAFKLINVQPEYLPHHGDWVNSDLERDSSGELTATNVRPLRQRYFEGCVTSVQRDHGYIDKDIYFTCDACLTDYRPRRGERVSGQAIESNRRWRATSVKPISEAEHKRMQVLSSLTEVPRPMMSRHCQLELMSDKNGVTITPELHIDNVRIDDYARLNATIRNNGDREQTYVGCKFCSSSSQCQFSVVSICREKYRGEQKKREVATGPVVLSLGATLTVTFFCEPRNLGRDQQLVLFEFDGFQIGRNITVNVQDPQQWSLEPSAPYQRKMTAGQYRQMQQGSGMRETWLVPGQRPQRSQQIVQLPNRLPHYPVPQQLTDCVLDEDGELEKVVPALAEPLSLDNYTRRFQALLHLEEIQQEMEIREFDMHNVGLRQFAEYLALRVPGLAEGRPSVLVGDRVILSEPELISEGPEYEGYVHEVLRDEVLLKFQEEFQQRYNGEDYNARFVFNRTPLRRGHQAVAFAPTLGSSVLFPSNLIPKVPQTKIGASDRSPSVSSSDNVVQATLKPGIRRCPLGKRRRTMSGGLAEGKTFYNTMLNTRQRAAIIRILHGQSRPTPYILFGPPGTGKTVTFVEAILQVFHEVPHSRIVACAPSNSAVDLLAERLHASGKIKQADMVRLNAFHRELEQVPESIQCYCSNGEDLEVVARYRIVVCTCSSAGMMFALGLRSGHFTHAFIDEAGQATEPECMIPIGLVAGSDGQVVLAGDPMQLGPVLRSKHAQRFGLGLSLLERLIQRDIYARDEVRFADHGCYDPLLVTKLVNNYRSHAALLRLPSQIFYDDELEVAADPDHVQCLCAWPLLPNKEDMPLVFHGLRGEDLREGNSPSWFNAVESLQVMKYLQALINNSVHPLTYDDIGIITPYRKQVEKIRMLIDKLGMEKVKVGSVEEFQGQERLVMIISTVRSNESHTGHDVRHNLGFLSNPKRFNVAITRAEALLIILGNPHVLAQDVYWRSLLVYCVKNGAYTGCDLPDLGTEREGQAELERDETVEKSGTEAADCVEKVAAEVHAHPAQIEMSCTEDGAANSSADVSPTESVILSTDSQLSVDVRTDAVKVNSAAESPAACHDAVMKSESVVSNLAALEETGPAQHGQGQNAENPVESSTLSTAASDNCDNDLDFEGRAESVSEESVTGTAAAVVQTVIASAVMADRGLEASCEEVEGDLVRSAEIDEFCVSATSSTTEVVEDVTKMRNMRISGSEDTAGHVVEKEAVDVVGGPTLLTAHRQSNVAEASQMQELGAARPCSVEQAETSHVHMTSQQMENSIKKLLKLHLEDGDNPEPSADISEFRISATSSATEVAEGVAEMQDSQNPASSEASKGGSFPSTLLENEELVMVQSCQAVEASPVRPQASLSASQNLETSELSSGVTHINDVSAIPDNLEGSVRECHSDVSITSSDVLDDLRDVADYLDNENSEQCDADISDMDSSLFSNLSSILGSIDTSSSNVSTDNAGKVVMVTSDGPSQGQVCHQADSSDVATSVNSDSLTTETSTDASQTSVETFRAVPRLAVTGKAETSHENDDNVSVDSDVSAISSVSSIEDVELPLAESLSGSDLECGSDEDEDEEDLTSVSSSSISPLIDHPAPAKEPELISGDESKTIPPAAPSSDSTSTLPDGSVPCLPALSVDVPTSQPFKEVTSSINSDGALTHAAELPSSCSGPSVGSTGQHIQKDRRRVTLWRSVHAKSSSLQESSSTGTQSSVEKRPPEVNIGNSSTQIDGPGSRTQKPQCDNDLPDKDALTKSDYLPVTPPRSFGRGESLKVEGQSPTQPFLNTTQDPQTSPPRAFGRGAASFMFADSPPKQHPTRVRNLLFAPPKSYGRGSSIHISEESQAVLMPGNDNGSSSIQHGSSENEELISGGSPRESCHNMESKQHVDMAQASKMSLGSFGRGHAFSASKSARQTSVVRQPQGPSGRGFALQRALEDFDKQVSGKFGLNPHTNGLTAVPIPGDDGQHADATEEKATCLQDSSPTKVASLQQYNRAASSAVGSPQGPSVSSHPRALSWQQTSSYQRGKSSQGGSGISQDCRQDMMAGNQVLQDNRGSLSNDSSVSHQHGKHVSGPVSAVECAIIRQVEYYFGDFNLSKDQFMLDQMAANDGCVSLSVLMTFNKMKELTGDPDVIRSALGKSSLKLVKVSDDGAWLMRSEIFPLPDFSRQWMNKLKMRSVLVDRVPQNAQLEQLEQYFSFCGPVAHIEFLPIHNRAMRERPMNRDVIVVYHERAGAEALLKMRTITFGHSQLRASRRHDIHRQLYSRRKPMVHQKFWNQNGNSQLPKSPPGVQKEETTEQFEDSVKSIPTADVEKTVETIRGPTSDEREDIAIEQSNSISHVPHSQSYQQPAGTHTSRVFTSTRNTYEKSEVGRPDVVSPRMFSGTFSKDLPPRFQRKISSDQLEDEGLCISTWSNKSPPRHHPHAAFNNRTPPRFSQQHHHDADSYSRSPAASHGPQYGHSPTQHIQSPSMSSVKGGYACGNLSDLPGAWAHYPDTHVEQDRPSHPSSQLSRQKHQHQQHRSHPPANASVGLESSIQSKNDTKTNQPNHQKKSATGLEPKQAVEASKSLDRFLSLYPSFDTGASASGSFSASGSVSDHSFVSAEEELGNYGNSMEDSMESDPHHSNSAHSLVSPTHMLSGSSSPANRSRDARPALRKLAANFSNIPTRPGSDTQNMASGAPCQNRPPVEAAAAAGTSRTAVVDRKLTSQASSQAEYMHSSPQAYAGHRSSGTENSQQSLSGGQGNHQEDSDGMSHPHYDFVPRYDLEQDEDDVIIESSSGDDSSDCD